MAIKKSQLYSSLWESCDELRGGMDASQYKDYILTLLFVKYVTDKQASDPDALIIVPEGGGFNDMVRAKGDKEVGDKVNKIIARLAEANNLKGIITIADFNDENKLGRGQELQDRVTKLIGIFEDLDLRTNRVEGDDLLGDAYEYLMRHFATQSGKSKGQFYTPAEVSRVMAKVVGIGRDTRRAQTIYDPTCGSGSLLLKAAAEAPHGLTIFGQENDNATWALAYMNMILHDHATAELWRGNTLAAPHFKNRDETLKTYDFAVANPPFSQKAWATGFDPARDEFERFEDGIPPAKNGDYAFLLHVLKSLKSTGKGAIILPHGVLFRGNAEATIRRNLIRRGVIKGVIGLPANLFYGTGIPACIVVLDKEGAAERQGIFMIDASRGFRKDGPKNRLRSQDIHQIVDIFTRQEELPRYSRFVPEAEIAANDYNLNLPRYIDSSEPEDLHDLDAHLNGGIPNRDIDMLAAYWEAFPGLRDEIFTTGSRPGYGQPKLAPPAVKSAILDHPAFQSYAASAMELFKAWTCAHVALLMELRQGVKPADTIYTIAEDLLQRFAHLPLLDKYDVYQRLMDYWADTMQDDVYLIAADGWTGAAQPATLPVGTRETPDLTIGRKKYRMDLVPPALIVARFFASDRAVIDQLEAERDRAAREREEFVDEHGGDEGLLTDAMTDSGTVTRSSVREQLKAIRFEPDGDEERVVLNLCLTLIDAESEASRSLKNAQAYLETAVLARYQTLTEDDIRLVTIHDKWFAAIQTSIDSEVQRLTNGLVSRVRTLEERYADSLPSLVDDVDVLTGKVEKHLHRLGLAWA